MPAPAFKPGFRFSALDGVILLLGAALAAGAWLGPFSSLAWMVAMAVGHFFLFCNVFRISRVPELIWSGVFLALLGATAVASVPGWPLATAVCVVVSSLLIWRQTTKPDYHGVCWQRWNPGLPEWWQAQIVKPSPQAADSA